MNFIVFYNFSYPRPTPVCGRDLRGRVDGVGVDDVGLGENTKGVRVWEELCCMIYTIII